MVLIQGYAMGKSQKQLSFSLAYKPRRTDKNALGNTVNWLMKANENHFSPLFMDLLDIISSLQIQEHSIYIGKFCSTISSAISFLCYISEDPTPNSSRFQCYLSVIFKSTKLPSNLFIFFFLISQYYFNSIKSPVPNYLNT